MTPDYMLGERTDGRRAGVIYQEDLEGAFRRVQAWQAERSDNRRGAGAVLDLAA